MALMGPGVNEVKELHDNGDVVGLVKLYGSTRRRDTRTAVIKALQRMGEPARQTLLDVLGGEELQRTAGALLVETGTESLADATAMLDGEDATRRIGALYTIYYYARYRDMAEAFETLQRIAARDEPADLAEAAAGMVERTVRLREERVAHIEALLTKIALTVQEEAAAPSNVLYQMYSSKRRDRVNTMAELLAMRYTALQPVVDRAGEFGDVAVATLLGLGLNEIGPAVLEPIESALPDADKRTKSVLMRALICMQHAGIPGAAEVIEGSGIRITPGLDRAAAKVYKTWVKT